MRYVENLTAIAFPLAYMLSIARKIAHPESAGFMKFGIWNLIICACVFLIGVIFNIMWLYRLSIGDSLNEHSTGMPFMILAIGTSIAISIVLYGRVLIAWPIVMGAVMLILGIIDIISYVKS